jgi:hypothetical protein
VTLLVETGVGVSYGGSMMHKNNPLRGGFLWFSSTFSLGVGIGILILCALGCTAPGRFIISVHEGEVQARVDKRFPIREKKMAFEIRLERPSVFFSQSGHVEILTSRAWNLAICLRNMLTLHVQQWTELQTVFYQRFLFTNLTRKSIVLSVFC